MRAISLRTPWLSLGKALVDAPLGVPGFASHQNTNWQYSQGKNPRSVPTRASNLKSMTPRKWSGKQISQAFGADKTDCPRTVLKLISCLPPRNSLIRIYLKIVA